MRVLDYHTVTSMPLCEWMEIPEDVLMDCFARAPIEMNWQLTNYYYQHRRTISEYNASKAANQVH